MPTNRSQRKNRQPKPKPRSSRRTTLLDVCVYALLLVTTFAVYAQVREFDFINYDDPEYVSANPHVLQGITAPGVAWAFSSREAANWLPLTRLSHMLDVQLFGTDSGLHHLTSVVFHVLATLLLFALLKRATQARWPSAFVAFVFALHPLHVESVAWISERKDVLSAFFFFLTLYLYVRYAERPAPVPYFAALFSFCLGVMAKPMLVTLPFVLLLLDYWPLRRLAAAKPGVLQVIREKLPFLAVSAGLAVITYVVQQNSRAIKPFPIGLRVANALIAYATYIGKLFWPSKLAIFYPYPRQIAASAVILAATGLLAMSVMVVRAWRNHPYLLVGWLWYLGTLIPVVGFIQVGAQARADRYTYIPMVGLLIMLAWGGLGMVQRWPRTKFAVATAAAVACAVCAILTGIQLQYWTNSESVFEHALAVTKDNYVAHHNLGLAIADSPGRLPEAMAHYRAALAIQPESVEARSDLGNALAKSGQFKDAIDEYVTALRMAPDCGICRTNLAVAQAQWGQELFKDGVALQKSGEPAQAVERFRAALRLAPGNAEAHNDLGVALASSGRTAEAAQEFKAALRLKPDYADAKYNLDAASAEASSRR